MWIVLVIFAAFGLLCALWVCFGFLLPGQKGVVMVYRCRGESVDALVVVDEAYMDFWDESQSMLDQVKTLNNAVWV